MIWMDTSNPVICEIRALIGQYPHVVAVYYICSPPLAHIIQISRIFIYQRLYIHNSLDNHLPRTKIFTLDFNLRNELFSKTTTYGIGRCLNAHQTTSLRHAELPASVPASQFLSIAELSPD